MVKRGCWKHHWFIGLGLKVEVYGQDIFCHVFSQWQGIYRLAKCYWADEFIKLTCHPREFWCGDTEWPGDENFSGPSLLSWKQKRIPRQLVFLLWLRNIWAGRWDSRHVRAWRTSTRKPGPQKAQGEGHRLIWAIPLWNYSQRISGFQNPTGYSQLLMIYMEAIICYLFYRYPFQAMQ